MPRATQITRTAPLSPTQESLWFLHELGDGSAYVEACGIRLRGRLCVDSLRHALEVLAYRHESLRTTFEDDAGAPVQVVRDVPDVHLPLLDLSLLRTEARSLHLARVVRQEAVRPFDLRRGPLFRAMLVRLQPDEHVFLWSFHHICGDGWSLGILSRELEHLYTSRVSGRDVRLEPPVTQYCDYADWLRERSTKGRISAALAFWKRHLDGAPPILALPLDRARSATQSFDGGLLSTQMGSEVTAQIKAFSRSCRATTYMTSLAAFVILLGRYSRQDDLVIGSPFANRGESRFESTVGFFANMLALRFDLSGDPTTQELVARVKDVVLAAYENGDAPFEKVVEVLRPVRDLSFNPVFQVSYSWQPAVRLEDMTLPGIRISPLEQTSTRAKFDLNVAVRECSELGLCTQWEYNSSLFDEHTIERMILHFGTILAELVKDPTRRISELNLVSDQERRWLATRWAAREEQPKCECIHQLFEERAALQPDAVAVVCEGESVTYGELDARANALANYLRSVGVGSERRVGLFLDRSPAIVIGILATLKAGGAYVPIDPIYPEQRIAAIAADAGVVVCITQDALSDALPDLPCPTVVLERDWDRVINTPPVPKEQVIPDHAAYLIYTSGSTGTPKGVVVSHYNVVRLMRSTERWFQFDARDVWTLFHSYAFDFSVWEIWGALLYGGRLVVVPYRVSRSPDDFYRMLCQEQVSVLCQTPSAFYQLSRVEDRAGVATDLALRLVIFGGEALEFAALAPWVERHGVESPALVNMYGITETTVHVTYRRVHEEDVGSARSSMIGEPIPDLGLHILDAQLRPVPIGIPGELFISGAGLARGYLNRPELTEQRFLRLADRSGTRVYRSGDLVRARPDGDLEYMGRLDHQIQLRGFRIELGEIEARLLELPGVLEAAAIVREDAPGDQRIVAYVVLHESAQFSPDSLRSALAEGLPGYMVPSAVVRLDELPITQNGKLHRAALPAPVARGDEAFAPRTALELELFEIWSTTLGSASFGIRDSFFDLGGHSLLAVRLLHLIEARVGLEIPLVGFLQAPTIEAMARWVSGASVRTALSVKLQASGSGVPFFCVPGSGGIALALRELARSLPWDRPFVALQRPGLASGERPYERVEHMASLGLRAIRELQPHGPYLVGGHSFGAWVAFEIARLLHASGETVALLSVLDMPAPPECPLGGELERGKSLRRFSEMVASVYGDSFVEDDVAIDAAALLAQIRDGLTQKQLLPAGAAGDQIQAMLAVLEADDRALRAYAIAESDLEQFELPIAVFRTSTHWDDWGGKPLDDTLGWKRVSAGPIDLHCGAGDHGSMLRPPAVGELARILGAQMDRSLSAVEKEAEG